MGAVKAAEPVSSFTEVGDMAVWAYSTQANANNEDRFLVDGPGSLFGVFDGHGGFECSSFATSRLPEVFGEAHKKRDGGREEESEKASQVLTEALKQIDLEWIEKMGAKKPTCGSCACIAHIEAGTLMVANIGDSRAVMGRQTSRRARGFTSLALSVDQNTSNEAECKLVKARSGDPSASGAAGTAIAQIVSTEAIRGFDSTVTTKRVAGAPPPRLRTAVSHAGTQAR